MYKNPSVRADFLRPDTYPTASLHKLCLTPDTSAVLNAQPRLQTKRHRPLPTGWRLYPSCADSAPEPPFYADFVPRRQTSHRPPPPGPHLAPLTGQRRSPILRHTKLRAVRSVRRARSGPCTVRRWRATPSISLRTTLAPDKAFEKSLPGHFPYMPFHHTL